MKRWVLFLSAITLLFTLTSCQKNPSVSQETSRSSGEILPTYAEDVPFTPIGSVGDYFEANTYIPPNKKGNIQYLFHKPIRDTGKAYPLIIYLHGKGNTVTQNYLGTAKPMATSLMTLENLDEKYSAYTLVPSTPLASEGWWTNQQINLFKELIQELINTYNIDTKRIYLTGISMGGFITCRLVNEMPPNTFAAAVPLSGTYDLKAPDAHHNTAFRIYHSTKDTVVSVSCARKLYAQLQNCNHPNVKYFEFPEGDHNTPLYSVYGDHVFYKWLFAQKLP